MSDTNKPREGDECPARKEAWQGFMRERLNIEPHEAKYVASGFSLRDMWTAHAAGYGAAYDALKAEVERLRAENTELNHGYNRYGLLINELRTSLKEAVEVLEFYANGEHFSSFTCECVERGDKADELLTKLKAKHGWLE